MIPMTVLALVLSALSPGASPQNPRDPGQGAPARTAEETQVPTLTGRVIDASTLRPIAGAIVEVGESRAVTDPAGRFALPVPGGEVRVKATAEGYLSDEVRVTIGRAPVVIEILLVRQARFKEVVTVTGTSAPAAPSPGTTAVSPLEVRAVAGAWENIFKTLQTLPGVNATADFDSRISVRGGGPDQNLTIMDGIEIHTPFRLLSLTSAFNPETVESFALTAGGFGAKYGDRLSSILEIENRAGTRAARLRATAGLSLTDTNVVVEGRLPGGRNGSWIGTGRRTYYDLVADKITGHKMPSFGDLQAKAAWDVARGGRLTLLGLRSREHSKVDDIVGSTRNDLLGVSFAVPVGRRATSRTVVAWSRYADGLRWNEDGPFYATQTQPGQVITQADLPTVHREVGLRDVSVRGEAGLDLGHGHLVGAGFDAHALRARWGWKNTGLDDLRDDVSEASLASFRGDFVMPTELNSRQDSARAGAWLQDTYRVASFATVQAGVRADWSRLAHETTISPRLSATVALPGKLRLRGATGLYMQSPGYEKLLQSDYFVNLTGAEQLSIKSERSVHLLAALERDFRGGFLVRIEGYHKSFDRMIVGQLEAPAAVAARVALYRYPQSLAFSVPSEPRLTSVPANDATGRAYGLDLYVSRRATGASDRFNGWASYTFGRAEMEAYGRRFPFDYDRRHAFSLVGVARLSARFDLASTVRVASGFPYTPDELRVLPRAVRDPATRNVIRYVPVYDSYLRSYRWTLYPGGPSVMNSQRLPVFARADMRLTFRPASHPRWQLYADIINVLSRKNASWYVSQLEYYPGADRPRVVRKPTAGLPILPSLGCRFSF